jgi:predicted PurR-regulated permease PerM
LLLQKQGETQLSLRNFIFFLIILSLILLYMVRAVLTPFILAALAAYILNPAVKLLQRKLKFNRVSSILVVSLLLVAGVIGAFYWIGGGLLSEARQVREQNRDLTFFDTETVETLPEFEYAGQKFGLKPVAEELPRTLADAATHWQDNLWPFVTDAFGRVLATLVFLLSTYYFLKDGHKFIDYFVSVFPKRYEPKAKKLVEDISQVLGNYLRGQILLVLIMSAASWLVLTILGVKFTLTLAVLTGFLELMPFFGPVIATTIAATTVYLTAENSWGLDPVTLTSVVIIVYISLRLLEDYFVIPQVLGHVTKLHPLLVLFAILVGGHVYGALGFILAVPLVAALRIILRFLIREVEWKS